MALGLEPELLRSPATHRRRVIFGAAVWSASLTALAWACALFLSPCETHAAKECTEEKPFPGLIRLLENANYTGTSAAFLYLYFRTTLRALRLVRLRDPAANHRYSTAHGLMSGQGAKRSAHGGVMLTGSVDHLTSHWTAAASSDIFLQVSKMLKALRVLLAPFNVLVFVKTIAGVVTTLATGTPFSRLESGFSCGDGVSAGSRLCTVVWEGHLLAFGLSIPLLVYLLSVLLLLPDALWSPTTLTAIKQTGEWRMARMRWLPVIVIFPAGVGIMTMIIYSIAGEKFDNPHTIYVVFFGNCVAILYQFCVIAWLFLPMGAPEPTVDTASEGRCPSSTVTTESAGQRVGIHARSSAWLPSLAKYFRIVLRSREAGARVEREAVLLMLASSLCQNEMFRAYDRFPGLMLVRWAFRVCALMFIVLVRDKTATFETLAKTGAAFGLVADIRDLRKALSHTLKFDEAFPATVRTYKASLMRMRDTITISYRWQSEDRSIAEGLQLNMSDWQLRSLLDALVHTNCKYVWLDRISVIQAPGELQRTLLSRMMAVYASSGCTLVLRSREQDGSRYHQRGWTVQEFCSCSKAYVVTETIGRGSTISTRKSRLRLAVVHASPDVTTAGQDEEEYFWSLRAWHHERVVHCTPFWLYGSDGLLEDDIEAAVLKYAELQRLVTTGKAKDMVRALVPMLANCPVETQDELVALLRLMDARVNSSDIQAMLAICMQKSRFASQSGSTGTAVIAASIPATTFSFFYETPSLEDIDPSGHQQQAANCSPLVTTTSLIQVEPHTPGADREDDIEANMLLAGCTALAPNANRVTFLRQ